MARKGDFKWNPLKELLSLLTSSDVIFAPVVFVFQSVQPDAASPIHVSLALFCYWQDITDVKEKAGFFPFWLFSRRDRYIVPHVNIFWVTVKAHKGAFNPIPICCFTELPNLCGFVFVFRVTTSWWPTAEQPTSASSVLLSGCWSSCWGGRTCPSPPCTE